MAQSLKIPDPMIQWAASSQRIDPRVLRALLQQESGGYQTRNGRLVTSRVGAIGAGQLMPATARGLGVDPRDPRQNVLGAAKYLRQQLDAFGGSLPKALAAYNAGPNAVRKYGGVPPFQETRDYVARITSSLGGAGADAPQLDTSPAAPAPEAGGGVADPRQLILARLIGRGSLGRAVAAKAFSSSSPAVPGPGVQDPSATHQTLPYRPYAGGGEVVGAPRDRAGVSTAPSVVDFVRKVAGIYGRPITLGTGTAHNQMSTSGRQSAHWTGSALDLPASGPALTRMGQAALIAAGADPAWARRQRGGLFNIGGHQIIFNTHIGGNHFDHLHVGERR